MKLSKNRSVSTGRLEQKGGLRLHIEKLGYKRNITTFHLIRQEIAPEQKKFYFISIDDAPTSKNYVKIYKPQYLPPLEHKDLLEGIDKILYERHHPEYMHKAQSYKNKHGCYAQKESRIPIIATNILESRRRSQEALDSIPKPQNKLLTFKIANQRVQSSFGNFLNQTQHLLNALD